MKQSNQRTRPRFAIRLARIMATAAALLAAAAVPANSVDFTYQGRLTANGLPANGSFDFEVRIFDAQVQGTELSLSSAANVDVENGLFTLQLNGPDDFLDVDPWLELRVRPSGSEPFTPLTPRQPLYATPLAHRAYSVNDGSVTAQSVADDSIGVAAINSAQVQVRVGQICPSGSAMREINADGSVVCQSAGVDAAWSLDGNAGTNGGLDFIGTTDNEPLDLRVNNTRGLRLNYETLGGGLNGVAITGGNPSNSIAAGGVGSVIAGGGTGGAPNLIQGEYNFLGAGSNNSVSGGWSVVGGGSNNDVSASWGFVGGGVGNEVNGNHGAILGGQGNRVDGNYAVALGRNAHALHSQSFVFNDGGSDFSSTADGQFLIDVADGVGIGQNNPTDLLHVSAPAGRNALRVQVDGVTRLRVHDNGGVSVGVNATPPAGGLLIEGDIKLRNDQLRWASYAYNAFSPTESQTSYINTGDALWIRAVVNNDGSVFASPLHLPHGAIITGIRAVVADADQNEDLRIEVTRRGIPDFSTTEIVEVFTTTSSPSIQVLNSSAVTAPVVDNQNYSYVVEIDASSGQDMQLYVYNVQVSYTVDTLLP